MTDYDYGCTWCLNKVVINVDHTVYLVCPICERRTLERKYQEVNEEAIEAFRKFVKKNIRKIARMSNRATSQG